MQSLSNTQKVDTSAARICIGSEVECEVIFHVMSIYAAHSHSFTHAHSHTHTRTHARTHARTHTHTRGRERGGHSSHGRSKPPPHPHPRHTHTHTHSLAQNVPSESLGEQSLRDCGVIYRMMCLPRLTFRLSSATPNNCRTSLSPLRPPAPLPPHTSPRPPPPHTLPSVVSHRHRFLGPRPP